MLRTVFLPNPVTCIRSDSTHARSIPSQRKSVYFSIMIMVPNKVLLCEYVDLGSHPTYVILDSGCTRAMGSRFAIDRLVQACQQHPKRDHIWFSKQPCSSKF